MTKSLRKMWPDQCSNLDYKSMAQPTALPVWTSSSGVGGNAITVKLEDNKWFVDGNGDITRLNRTTVRQV